jgi:hypothetical protein
MFAVALPKGPRQAEPMYKEPWSYLLHLSCFLVRHDNKEECFDFYSNGQRTRQNLATVKTTLANVNILALAPWVP